MNEKLAFPAVTIDGYDRVYHGGMTLRDYFAGQALAGWLSDPAVSVGTKDQAMYVARVCYEIADAMMEQRKVTS